MSRVLYLSLIISLAAACSVAPDYHFPTVEEQANSANYVVEGIVLKSTWDNEAFTGTTVIMVSKYHKGCGP